MTINEVSSASDTSFLDEDGSQEDWVELYNKTGSAINLQGYTITCAQDGKSKTWTFPKILIKPYDFVTIFCSEKNRTTYFDHWEVPVYAANPWKYYRPNGVEPPATWRDVSFNDASWQTGAGGIGYGDGDDATVIAPDTSLYMRKAFFIADTSKISTAALLIDYDDAFVAYLNNVEIARSNIGVYGDHPAHNTFAYDEHEAVNYQNGGFSGGYFVPPQVLHPTLLPGWNVFTIQTHNYNLGMDDMTCIPYFLIGVNDTTQTYPSFPANVHLHTNFNLNSSGEVLTLKDNLGNTLETDTIGTMVMNDSRGRRPDGAASWCLFDATTPDTTNNTSACYADYSPSPAFSLGPGFYNGTQMLSLSSGSGVVRWTNNGKDPTSSSPLYTTPISIDSTQVIRARVFPTVPTGLPGPILTRTYFINENITLPVVSLTSDPFNLFDWNYGIYVMGPNANTAQVPYYGANFWQGWERPGHIEFFDETNKFRFNSSSGLSIQGNFSKAWPQRGFSVKMKDDYNAVPVVYKLFPDKNSTTYKTFNIRNAGSDWNNCHFRDRFNQKTVQSTHIDIMDGRPCVLFINGKYWGVYELREKEDKYYIENNSKAKKDSIDFLEFDGSVIEGSNQGFLDMDNFISGSNMALQQNYDSAKNMLDIKNFCDYFITETYIINVDWLGTYTNNIKFWRPINPVGKWRYMLWDTDLSLGFARNWWTLGYNGVDTVNFLATAINPPVSNPHSRILKSLLANTEFKNYFVDRYADLINTIFHPINMQKRVTKFHDEVQPEMTRHFARWGGTSPMSPYIGSDVTLSDWEAQIDTLLDFANNRPMYARNHIQNDFSLVKQVNVTLNVQPAGAGTIKISTIVPDSLPWTGVYFDGVPVTMTARPNAGYKFRYWQSPIIMQETVPSAVITLNVDTNDAFTAYFDAFEYNFSTYPNPFSDALTINYEIPSDKQVYLELYDVVGRRVADIVPPGSFQTEGTHTITFDPARYSLASGTYFLRFRTDEFSKTEKVIRVKK